jgi:hypothetical protein
MALCNKSAHAIRPFLPCRILSLGWPNDIERLETFAASTMDVVDVVAHRGMERIVDLSYPIDLGQYDLVIDPGTLEHVPNIAQGFINAASAVRPGGHIMHHGPITMLNHGYWNLNPNWFVDFYDHNGFKIELMEMTSNGTCFDDVTMRSWPNSNVCERFVVPSESLILVVAERNQDRPISLPLCQSHWLTQSHSPIIKSLIVSCPEPKQA